MFTTNLLPPAEKNIIRREEVRRLVVSFAVAAAALFIFGSLLLLPSLFPLFFERREIKRRFDFENEVSQRLRVKEIMVEANNLRVLSSSLAYFTAKSGKTSGLLDMFLEARGQEVTISSLAITGNGKVTILGNALTRDGLLSFEKALRDSKSFTAISSPLSNIIKESDINFSFEGQLSPGMFP